MAVFLDSAKPEEVRKAMELGFVAGITTNPILIAKVGRPAYELMAELCRLCSGQVFYQPCARTLEKMEEEVRRFHALSPQQVVPKIPCDRMGLRLLAHLSSEMPCAVTAVFGLSQAYLACQAGARYIIPYVNRMSRLGGDGPGFIRRLVELLTHTGSSAEILAASLKSPQEAMEALLAGAHHITVPLSVLEAMTEHPLSAQAIEQFSQVGR